ncbi:hypothetical protein OROHE_019509 [Orobanche hederae]
MSYGPKYCLAGLLAILALISLSPSVVSEKAILMSYSRALKDLMSCHGTKALLVKANISPTDIISVCEYLKHVALSVDVNQNKVANHLPNIDISASDQFDIHSHKLNRYKNFETMGLRPTTPGHSPAVGHKK